LSPYCSDRQQGRTATNSIAVHTARGPKISDRRAGAIREEESLANILSYGDTLLSAGAVQFGDEHWRSERAVLLAHARVEVLRACAIAIEVKDLLVAMFDQRRSRIERRGVDWRTQVCRRLP